MKMINERDSAMKTSVYAGTYAGTHDCKSLIHVSWRAVWAAMLVAVTHLAPLSAVGAEIVWTGAVDSDWSSGENWNGGVPQSGDDVTIPAGKSATISVSSANLASITISGTLVMTNWTTCLNAGTVTIPAGGVLTCGAAATDAADLSRVWVKCADLSIASGGAIDVNYKGYGGYPLGSDHAGYGPGAGIVPRALYVTAPSHGGYGARVPNGSFALPNAMPYDDPAAPEQPGSSGPSSKYNAGLCGGGAVKIEATGAVVLDGSILANGENASAYGKSGNDNHAPAGAGGSVFVTCRTLSGTGMIAANGGGGSRVGQAGDPAGGGRIAIHYDADAQRAASVAGMTISAAAGRRWQTGTYAAESSSNVNDQHDPHGTEAGMGTVHFTDAQIALQISGKSLTGNVLGVTRFDYDGDWDFTAGRVMFGEEGVQVTVNGNLALSGDDSRLEIGGGIATNWANSVVMYAGTRPNGLTVKGDLTLGGVSRLDIRAAATNGVDKFGSLVKVGGTMTIAANCFVYSWSDCENLGSPHFEVGSLDVQEGATFSAFGRGGRGSYNERWTSLGNAVYGKGPGAIITGQTAGGSYGGTGGTGNYMDPRSTYGDALRPTMPGSGGASRNVSQWVHGGAGGGLIYVSATNGMIRVDGTLDARGVTGTIFMENDLNNGYGGGGSGGAILLEAKRFFGGATGSLLADGGTARPTSSLRAGSGGGGRIAVWCGAPWSEETKASRISSQATPISDKPRYMAYLGSYSAAGGAVLGDYGSDAQIGQDGTVRFCYVDGGAGFILVVR